MMDWKGCGLFEVVSQYFGGETEENHQELVSRGCVLAYTLFSNLMKRLQITEDYVCLTLTFQTAEVMHI
jgi:hypothetical protein